MARAAQHSSRNRSSDWHSKAMKLASRCGAPWPSGSINYADRLIQIASAENRQASKPPRLAPRANKERHPCKARRRRTPSARVWAPAGVRLGEPQECQRVSDKSAAPWSEPARPECVLREFPLLFDVCGVSRSRTAPLSNTNRDSGRIRQQACVFSYVRSTSS